MRSLLAIAAAALAAVAAIVASEDGDASIVPFFVGLTLAGALQAWATRPPFVRGRRWFAAAIALGWVGAAVWIGILLAWEQAMCACSRPPPTIEDTYLGLTATAYHLAAVYGGAALIVASRLLPGSFTRDGGGEYSSC